MPYEIEFTPPALRHVKALKTVDQRTILESIAAQLTHEPDNPTRHRKRLSENRLAPWELRIGDFRVFYDIDADASKVIVLAVGVKEHERLRIGDEEIQL